MYQPIFDLRTGRAHGFEAFARGPEGTELETFESLYEVAKTAGLVSELDRACCEKAILGATQLPAQCKLFVNTLPFSMHSENFKRKKLMDLFEKGRIVAQQIVWEISEQEPVRDCVVFADVMKERSEIGCQFAIGP